MRAGETDVSSHFHRPPDEVAAVAARFGPLALSVASLEQFCAAVQDDVNTNRWLPRSQQPQQHFEYGEGESTLVQGDPAYPLLTCARDVRPVADDWPIVHAMELCMRGCGTPAVGGGGLCPMRARAVLCGGVLTGSSTVTAGLGGWFAGSGSFAKALLSSSSSHQQAHVTAGWRQGACFSVFCSWLFSRRTMRDLLA